MESVNTSNESSSVAAEPVEAVSPQLELVKETVATEPVGEPPAQPAEVNPLQRTVVLYIPERKVEAELKDRLSGVARHVRAEGVKPGKASLQLVTDQYSDKIRQEILDETIQKELQEQIDEQDYELISEPEFNIELVEENEFHYKITATFEIYPEIVFGDFTQATVIKPVAPIGEEEIDNTLLILKKQKAELQATDGPVKLGDQVNIDYQGWLDGNEFQGGTATNFEITLGDGNLLKDFEDAILGMVVGEKKSFPLVFPNDYHDKAIAGKQVMFDLTLNSAQAKNIMEDDSEFAKLVGIENGDVTQMRQEIKDSLEFEVSQRVRVKLKEQVTQALIDNATCHIPQTLVEREIKHMVESAERMMKAQGASEETISQQAREMYQAPAERRVKIGLVLTKLADLHNLHATQEQVEEHIKAFLEGKENPAELEQKVRSNDHYLRQIQSVIVGNNIYNWAIKQIKVVEQPIPLNNLLQYSPQ